MKRLEEGIGAPMFMAQEIKGATINFRRSEKWTFISFHRFAACPFCNLYTHELIKAFPKFDDLRIEILSIWPSSLENMQKFVGQAEAPFPLVSDPGKEIYQKYKVVYKSKAAALFLVLKPRLVLNALKHNFKNTKVDSDLLSSG